ncbi:glutamyl-tRNA reductase [Pirellulaceae bacterium SH449]
MIQKNDRSTKELFLMGTSFRNAAACERKHLAFSKEFAQSIHQDISKEIGDVEFCMISTCNRVEFILFGPRDPSVYRRLGNIINRYCPHFKEMQEKGMIRKLQGTAAYEHVLSVTCGLESLILGDTQIVQQVRQALQFARYSGTSGAYLEQAIGRALSLGSFVRSETTISSGSSGVAAAICDTIDEWNDKSGIATRILLIGAGSINSGVARLIKNRGIYEISIANRTVERAQHLASKHSGKVIPWSELNHAIECSHVVVAATGSNEPIIRRALLNRLPKNSLHHTAKLIIDAGMPPNVEFDDSLPIKQIGIDNIREKQDQNLARRLEAVPDVERLIEIEKRSWQDWLDCRPLEDVLKSLYLDLAAAPSRITERLTGTDERSVEDIHYVIHRELKKLLHPHVNVLRSVVSSVAKNATCGKS